MGRKEGRPSLGSELCVLRAWPSENGGEPYLAEHAVPPGPQFPHREEMGGDATQIHVYLYSTSGMWCDCPLPEVFMSQPQGCGKG